MWVDNTWRGLAATYAAAAGVQLYIAVTSGVVWAVVLSAGSALVAVACGIAAWRAYGKTWTAGIAEPTRSDLSRRRTGRSVATADLVHGRRPWTPQRTPTAARADRSCQPSREIDISARGRR